MISTTNTNPFNANEQSFELGATQPFIAPEMRVTQDGDTLSVEAPRIVPEVAVGELGGQAVAGSNGVDKPFGVDLMTPFKGVELARRLTGSLPTNRNTNVINPHTKKPVTLSDGGDTSRDD